MTLIAPTLQAFFTDRLAAQLQASPATIASYRDTLRLLLGFAQEATGKAPSSLDWDELDETLVSSFLSHLERDRSNSVRTRNLRLTAIRSLFATPLCATPSTRPLSSVCSRSRRSALRSAPSRFSPPRRPRC
jgi:site-specific recombinase XerC